MSKFVAQLALLSTSTNVYSEKTKVFQHHKTYVYELCDLLTKY